MERKISKGKIESWKLIKRRRERRSLMSREIKKMEIRKSTNFRFVQDQFLSELILDWFETRYLIIFFNFYESRIEAKIKGSHINQANLACDLIIILDNPLFLDPSLSNLESF